MQRRLMFYFNTNKPQRRGGGARPLHPPPGFVPEEEAAGLSGFQNLFKD